MIGQARCLLENAGPSADAERAIADAIKAHPNDKQALCLRGRLLMERADYQQTMAFWTACAEQHPDLTESYAGAIEAASRCGEPAAAASLIAKAPPDLADAGLFEEMEDFSGSVYRGFLCIGS